MARLHLIATPPHPMARLHLRHATLLPSISYATTEHLLHYYRSSPIYAAVPAGGAFLIGLGLDPPELGLDRPDGVLFPLPPEAAVLTGLTIRGTGGVDTAPPHALVGVESLESRLLVASTLSRFVITM